MIYDAFKNVNKLAYPFNLMRIRARKQIYLKFTVFSPILMLQLDKLFRDKDIYHNLTFFNSLNLSFKSKNFVVFG